MWQALFAKYNQQNFVVIAVAMDSRPHAARPWIEQAAPDYPCLIDRNHHVADLYNMVNVPQAVWIDEDGIIVRPTESAGAFEGFRQMDRTNFQTPEAVQQKTAAARQTYLAAIADWINQGTASSFAFDAATARAHLKPTDQTVALANAHFRLGQYLLAQGETEAGEAQLQQAVALRPESWNFWRQAAPAAVMGLAAGPEFWTRVDALGENRYYDPVDMEGMP